MAGADRRRRSGSGRLLDALVWGAALGAASGAVLGAAVDGVGAGADGELRTDHSFSLAGRRFLTLHYEIERLPAVRA